MQRVWAGLFHRRGPGDAHSQPRDADAANLLRVRRLQGQLLLPAGALETCREGPPEEMDAQAVRMPT